MSEKLPYPDSPAPGAEEVEEPVEADNVDRENHEDEE